MPHYIKRGMPTQLCQKACWQSYSHGILCGRILTMCAHMKIIFGVLFSALNDERFENDSEIAKWFDFEVAFATISPGFPFAIRMFKRFAEHSRHYAKRFAWYEVCDSIRPKFNAFHANGRDKQVDNTLPAEYKLEAVEDNNFTLRDDSQSSLTSALKPI